MGEIFKNDARLETRLIGLLFILFFVFDFLPFVPVMNTVIIILWNLYLCRILFKDHNTGIIIKSFFVIGQIAILASIIYDLITPTKEITFDHITPGMIIFYFFFGLYIWSIILLASLLRKSENQRSIKKDGLMTFALIFVLPLGIWWIQPRVNKILINQV